MKHIVRRLYSLVPFKQQMFTIVRSFLRPGKGLYKHLHFKGDFEIQVASGRAIKMRHFGYELENDVFWSGLEGGWEKTSIGLWKMLVANSDVIFDIGANTGVYALIAKSLNPKAKVYAFEPVKRVYEKLLTNNELNSFDIVSLNVAASNTDGKAVIYDAQTEHVMSVAVNKDLTEPGSNAVAVEIDVTRLDTLIEKMSIPAIGLMKIDVETHEPEVLEGLGRYLNEFRPTMLIEILTDEVGERVEALVKDKNYLYFNIDEPTDSIRRVSTITKSDYYNYLICSEAVAAELNLLS